MLTSLILGVGDILFYTALSHFSLNIQIIIVNVYVDFIDCVDLVSNQRVTVFLDNNKKKTVH